MSWNRQNLLLSWAGKKPLTYSRAFFTVTQRIRSVVAVAFFIVPEDICWVGGLSSRTQLVFTLLRACGRMCWRRVNNGRNCFWKIPCLCVWRVMELLMPSLQWWAIGLEWFDWLGFVLFLYIYSGYMCYVSACDTDCYGPWSLWSHPLQYVHLTL